MKKYLKEKREELIFAISNQDYNNEDVGNIFNLNRATILRILKKKPKNYKPKWKKI